MRGVNCPHSLSTILVVGSFLLSFSSPLGTLLPLEEREIVPSTIVERGAAESLVRALSGACRESILWGTEKISMYYKYYNYIVSIVIDK